MTCKAVPPTLTTALEAALEVWRALSHDDRRDVVVFLRARVMGERQETARTGKAAQLKAFEAALALLDAAEG